MTGILYLVIGALIGFIITYSNKKNRELIEARQIAIDALSNQHATAKREIYLLKMVNEAMEVVETKRFIVQRMQNAPFQEVEYPDERCKV